MTALQHHIEQLKVEAARGELRQAAVNFAGLIGTDYDEDNYINAMILLEVAAEKWADAVRKNPLPAEAKRGEPIMKPQARPN